MADDTAPASDEQVAALIAQYDADLKLHEGLRDKLKAILEDLIETKNLRVHSVTGRVKERDKFEGKVTFDPAVLSFRDLLTVFFTIHDPTTKDRQGNDVGTQYRSVIFCQTPEQRADAEAVIANLTSHELWRDPIVTEIAEAETFYPAENYHQDYFARNGSQPYCQIVVAPKVAKFRKAFADRLKKKAIA